MVLQTAGISTAVNTDIDALIAEANIIVKMGFSKSLESYDPGLQQYMYEFSTDGQETVTFNMQDFIKTFTRFDGQRVHERFPDGQKFIVTAGTWDMAVDIPRKKLLASKTVDGINMYTDQAQSIGIKSMNHDKERMIIMLFAGAASTYGLCFDGKALFANDHAYLSSTGQDNLLAGSGTSEANILADLATAESTFASFVYDDGSDLPKQLNSMTNIKYTIVCPTALLGVFTNLSKKDKVSSGESNPYFGKLNVVSVPGQTDVNDWYVLADDGDAVQRPFLRAVQMEVTLDTPEENKQLLMENDVATYGGRKYDEVVYGAWWKALKFVNT